VAASPSSSAIFSMTASASALGANNTNGSATAGVNTSITGPGGTFNLNQNAAATTVTPAFSAAAAVSPVTMFRGSSGTVAVNVTFNTALGTVTAAAGTLPPGITFASASAPASLTATGSFSFSLATSGTAPASAIVPILVTGGGVTQTVNVTVNFQDPFTIAPVSPVNIFLGTSSAVSVSITINAPGAFVFPGAPTYPAGFSSAGSVSPGSLSTNGTFSFPVSAPSTASSGLATFSFSSGGFTASVTVTLNAVPAFTAVAVTPNVNMFYDGSVSLTISVTYASGFTGSVGHVELSSLPCCFPISHDAPPGDILNASGNIIHTLTDAGDHAIPITLPPVTYRVSDLSGATFVDVSFNVTLVNPYSISLSAPAVLQIGTNGTFTVNVTAAPGFSGSVFVQPSESSFTGLFTPTSTTVAVTSGSTVPVNFTVSFAGTAGTVTFSANTSSGNFFLQQNAPNTTTITAVGGGAISVAGSPSGTPGTTVSVPIQLSLNPGVMADTLSFGVSVTAQGGAPALVGTGGSNELNFSPGSLPAPNTIDRGVAGSISVLWSTAFTPVSGSVSIGNVTLAIPAGATSGQSYAVVVTGGSATLSPSTPVSITAGAAGTVFVTAPAPAPLSTLVMRAEDLTYTPSLPREGETVRFRARISNRGAQASQGLTLALMRGETVLASSKVDLDAGRSATAELEWKAERGSSNELRLALVGAPGVSISLRNLAVARRDELGVARRDRATLTARNEDCAGLRLRSASQSSCGGSADLELMPVITAAGTLEVRVNLPDGGINDMGAMPLGTGSSAVLPQDAALQSQAFFVEGHTYLVRTRKGTALVRVARIRSTLNPKIAVITGGGSPVSGVGAGTGGNDRAGRTGSGQRLPTTPTDPLTDVRDQERNDRLLSNAQITVDLEIILFEGAR